MAICSLAGLDTANHLVSAGRYGWTGWRENQEAMSANDYYEMLKKRNPKVEGSKKLLISNKELERHIKLAFEAGAESGQQERSLFEKIFG